MARILENTTDLSLEVEVTRRETWEPGELALGTLPGAQLAPGGTCPLRATTLICDATHHSTLPQGLCHGTFFWLTPSDSSSHSIVRSYSQF